MNKLVNDLDLMENLQISFIGYLIQMILSKNSINNANRFNLIVRMIKKLVENFIVEQIDDLKEI
jgi:hypothetical protein